MAQLHSVGGCGQDRLRHAGLDRVLIEKTRPPVKFVDESWVAPPGQRGQGSAERAGLGSQLPTPGVSLDQALCFATNPRALLVRIPANEQMSTAGDPAWRSQRAAPSAVVSTCRAALTAIATLHRPKGGVTWPACDVCC